MGLFKDFKDDFSQAVNEMMPGADAPEKENKAADLVADTLGEEVDVKSELSKLDRVACGQVWEKSYSLMWNWRNSHTKSDWIMWTAAMSSDKETFQKFSDPVYKYINETVSRQSYI